MFVKDVRSSAKQILTETAVPIRRLTLRFMLMLQAVMIPCELYIIFCEESAAASAAQSPMILLELLTLLMSAFEYLFEGGYTTLILGISHGEVMDRSALFAGFQQFKRLLLLFVLKFALILFWSMLFLIPGLIAFYRYRFAEMALLEHPEFSAMEALQYSMRLTNGRKLELFLLDLSFLLHHLILFVLTSYSLLAEFFGYTFRGLALNIGIYLGTTVLLIVVEVFLRPLLHTSLAEAYKTAQSALEDQ